MKLMIDTNAYSAFKRGDKSYIDSISQADIILVPTPVLGELRAGFRAGTYEERNLIELASFLSSPRVRVHPLGEETAIFYAELWGSLRAAGTPIPTNDLWIAAAALECGAILLTQDAHFNCIPGLIRR